MNLDFKNTIEHIFNNIFSESPNQIVPCGNHELKRNMVFIVSLNFEKFVIKFFYKPDKRNREINTLSLYKEGPLKILYQGETHDGVEWVIYNYIEGELFEDIFERLSHDEKASIFKSLGEKMAKFHNVAKFPYFGDWCLDRQSPIESYKSFIIEDTERVISNIYNQKLPGMTIIEKSIQLLRLEYSNVVDLKEGSLCHRDLDGRNILIKKNATGSYELTAFLDFEKCVVYNPIFDIVGLYRKYFLKSPDLISSFFKGYHIVRDYDKTFNQTLRFYLFRSGVDLCSWTYSYSKDFFNEGLEFLETLLSYEEEKKFDLLFIE